MAEITDKIEECPYMCEHCKHFIKGLTCAAFDIIPIEIVEDGAESHNHIFEWTKRRLCIHPCKATRYNARLC
jgi:hypothetical protein